MTFNRPKHCQVTVAECILAGDIWITPESTSHPRTSLIYACRQAGLVQVKHKGRTQWAVTEQVHDKAMDWAEDVMRRKFMVLKRKSIHHKRNAA